MRRYPQFRSTPNAVVRLPSVGGVVITQTIAKRRFPQFHNTLALVADIPVFTAGGSQTYSVSVAETGTAADTVSNGSIFSVGITESGSASDSPSTRAIYPSQIAESGSATDNPNNGNIYSASVEESESLADICSASSPIWSVKAVTVGDWTVVSPSE